MRFFTIFSILYAIMIKFKFVPFCVFFVKQSLSRLCSGAICAFFFFFVFFLFTFFLFAVSVPAALAEGDVSVSALSWQCASDPDSGSFVSPVFRDFSREIGIAVSEDFSGMRETFTESDDFSGTGDVFGMQDRLEAGGTSVCFVPTLTDNLGMVLFQSRQIRTRRAERGSILFTFWRESASCVRGRILFVRKEWSFGSVRSSWMPHSVRSTRSFCIWKGRQMSHL